LRIFTVIFVVNIDVANLKQYLNAIKAKQGVLNARNAWSAVGNPTSALGPSGLAPIGIHHLLLSNLPLGSTNSAKELKESNPLPN